MCVPCRGRGWTDPRLVNAPVGEPVHESARGDARLGRDGVMQLVQGQHVVELHRRDHEVVGARELVEAVARARDAHPGVASHQRRHLVNRGRVGEECGVALHGVLPVAPGVGAARVRRRQVLRAAHQDARPAGHEGDLFDAVGLRGAGLDRHLDLLLLLLLRLHSPHASAHGALRPGNEEEEEDKGADDAEGHDETKMGGRRQGLCVRVGYYA